MFLPNFSVTGISLDELDINTEYPVIAIYIKHTHILSTRLGSSPIREVEKNYFSINKQIYAKDSLFLIANQHGQFRWISPEKCNLFLPELFSTFILHDKKRLTRYSIKEEVGGHTNMIIPIRPFSITGISEEGFTSGKGYAVLAIDIDQYFPETSENEEGAVEEHTTQSTAVFLVGNDTGEFVWIAEDECHLFNIDSSQNAEDSRKFGF